MKRIMWIAAAAALLFAVSAALGQKQIEKKIIMKKGFPACAGLTDEQQKKIDALDLEAEKAILPIRAQIEVKAAELKELALAENPDKGAIDKKIEETGALRTQIMKKKIQSKLAVRALLTPDQRVEFDRKVLRGGRGLMECGEEGPGPGMGKFMMMRGMRHGGGEMMRHPGFKENEEKEVEK